ncbi:hypothetical protein SAMN04488601_1012641 [Paenibacillus sp. 453mf]|nr:hypothetical protein SAMN04488601_1012641 [Paenibacillus sp. 453mf]
MERTIPRSSSERESSSAAEKRLDADLAGVGGTPASAIKAGYAGVPIVTGLLSGLATTVKMSIDTYREAAQRNGHDPAKLPLTISGLFNAAETSQQAIKEMYPHLNTGTELVNGRSFPSNLLHKPHIRTTS